MLAGSGGGAPVRRPAPRPPMAHPSMPVHTAPVSHPVSNPLEQYHPNHPIHQAVAMLRGHVQPAPHNMIAQMLAHEVARSMRDPANVYHPGHSMWSNLGSFDPRAGLSNIEGDLGGVGHAVDPINYLPQMPWSDPGPNLDYQRGIRRAQRPGYQQQNPTNITQGSPWFGG